MSKLLLNRFALMLLITAMMSNTLWGFGVTSFTHDLDHLRKAGSAVALHDEVCLDATGVSDDEQDDAAGPLIHHMLHAVDHLQLFPHDLARMIFTPRLRVLVSPESVAIFLPVLTLAPPFRPPRSDVLSA